MSENKMSMGHTRRIITVLVAGLLLSALVAIGVGRSASPARAGDDPAPRLEAAPPAPATSTTTPAPAIAVRTGSPADVPSDPYAAEPVIQIGTIEIPRIGLVHPIFEGITMRNIDKGPSHWPGTALPGTNGNAVFAGHRVTHTHPFLEIDRLVAGDKVVFTVNGVRSVYSVTGHEVVSPTKVSIGSQTSTPTATLFACHPPHSASFRYVVHLALLADQS